MVHVRLNKSKNNKQINKIYRLEKCELSMEEYNFLKISSNAFYLNAEESVITVVTETAQTK